MIFHVLLLTAFNAINPAKQKTEGRNRINGTDRCQKTHLSLHYMAPQTPKVIP
uniref:Uncharacterized protein n=1 Tax=Rhizophora mucronata TaxID=61149 RepID=A0A2P2NUX0_RHIMU